MDADVWALRRAVSVGVSAAAIAERVVRGVVAANRRNAGLLRALHLYLTRHPDAEIRRWVEEQNARGLDQVVELFRPVMAEIRHAEPEVAVRAGLVMVALALRALLLQGKPLPASLGVEAERLDEELVRMYVRYLGLG